MSQSSRIDVRMFFGHVPQLDPGEVAYFQRLDEIKGRSKVVKNRDMATGFARFLMCWQ